MGKIDTGGAAFPSMAVAVTARDSSGEIARQMQATGVAGMTLRDWFAGMALQGLLAGSENMSIDTAARLSYTAADMMIAERAKR